MPLGANTEGQEGTAERGKPSWRAQSARDERQRSEHPIVPTKQGNPSHGEPAEGRGCREEDAGRGAGIAEPLEGKMAGTSDPMTVSTKLQRIAELARRSPDMVINTLAHHVDVEFLREAHRRTRKSGAPGVDGQTADEYAKNLEGNLRSLLERFKSGAYRAPPVRRVHIPKGDGDETRPIGIPTFEDKVLQRAVTMVLEAVYEQDFLDCSYGFRPRRSVHQAIEALWKKGTDMNGGWVLEVDIKGFFDALGHSHLREILDQRVRDGVLRRTINKWLKAGVQEDGSLKFPESGSPQGGVVSPLLANVYLHTVVDTWFEHEIKPRLEGDAFMIRYADDVVIVFASVRDARQVKGVLPKRFGKYGLELHPKKTRLVPFRRPKDPPEGKGSDEWGARPQNFDFLGFRHYWGQSRRGRWTIKRKTDPSRLRRALRRIQAWCRRNRHKPIKEQQLALSKKLRGHYGFYGITGNSKALGCFLKCVERTWKRWLDRRSQRARMRWAKFWKLLARYPLPEPRVVHSALR